MSGRKRIARLGIRPHTVSVFSEDTTSGRYCRCHWRSHGKLTTRSWPDTGVGRREAKEFAERLAMLLRSPEKPAPLNLGALWQRYQAGEFEALREKTRINYARHWRAWETFAGGETVAESVTRESLDEFRKELKRLGIAISQIRKHVELVKRVYRFGVDRELLPAMRLLDYRVKIAKDEKATATAEYRSDDAIKIIAQLDPKNSRQWRAWVFCVIAHYTGARANAILHLRWQDYDGESIIWRAQYDKVGKERAQPVPRQVVEALRIARVWSDTAGKPTPWILFSPKAKTEGKPVTYGGLHWMLRRAEHQAGVEHVPMNAMHRFRRGVVGDVVDATGGNVRLAMAYVGDSVGEAVKYVKDRDEQLKDVAALLSEKGGDD